MAIVDSERFAREEFGQARLGDSRLTSRLVWIAERLARLPEMSFPKVFQDRHQAKAVYRFASNEKVSHEAVSTVHFEATARRCEGVKRLLVPADTTHISLGGRQERDFGPIDTKGKTRGFLAHSALALDGATRRPLGLLGQHVWVRPLEKRPATETAEQRQRRPRESQKWSIVANQVKESLGSLAVAPHVVHVFDAEGDIFEALETLEELGHGFIIRAAKDRLLESEDDEKVYLAQAALQAPARGSMEVLVHGKDQRVSRQARLELRSTTVLIQPPRSRDRRGLSQEVSVVLALKTNPPAQEEPISWLLLTREPCATRVEAEAVVRDYSSRWTIEEFHMALKTGCSLEARQLQSFDAMAVLLAICNPIASALLLLRSVARTEREAPAEDVLSTYQLAALRKLRPKLPPHPSAYVALREVAALGGFLGRKSDGEPGWRTLWSGFRDLLIAELALKPDENCG